MNGRRLGGPIAAATLLAVTVIVTWLVIEGSQELPLVTWLGTLPFAVIFAAASVFWVLFALVAWWIAERALDQAARDRTQENVSRILIIVSTFFVFVLGFVISQEWSNANAARNDVSRGAAAIYTAGYNAYPLPRSSIVEIQASLDELSRSIVCREIPALEETGKGAPQTGMALADSFKVATEQPRSVQEMVTFDNIVGALGTVSEARREWLTEAASGLPDVVLIAIVILGMTLVATFAVQATVSRRGHVATVIVLALLVALGTSLAVSLARPFAGAAQVGAETLTQGAGTSQAIEDCGRPARR